MMRPTSLVSSLKGLRDLPKPRRRSVKPNLPGSTNEPDFKVSCAKRSSERERQEDLIPPGPPSLQRSILPAAPFSSPAIGTWQMTHFNIPCRNTPVCIQPGRNIHAVSRAVRGQAPRLGGLGLTEVGICVNVPRPRFPATSWPWALNRGAVPGRPSQVQVFPGQKPR